MLDEGVICKVFFNNREKYSASFPFSQRIVDLIFIKKNCIHHTHHHVLITSPSISPFKTWESILVVILLHLMRKCHWQSSPLLSWSQFMKIDLFYFPSVLHTFDVFCLMFATDWKLIVSCFSCSTLATEGGGYYSISCTEQLRYVNKLKKNVDSIFH